MDRTAQLFWMAWPWFYPAALLCLALWASFKKRYGVSAFLVLAACFNFSYFYLFSFDPTFTEGWETDSPAGVTYVYNPLGFLVANGLPIGQHLCTLGALLLLLRNPRA